VTALVLANAAIQLKNLDIMAIQYVFRAINVVQLVVNGFVVLVMVLLFHHVLDMNKDLGDKHVNKYLVLSWIVLGPLMAVIMKILHTTIEAVKLTVVRSYVHHLPPVVKVKDNNVLEFVVLDVQRGQNV